MEGWPAKGSPAPGVGAVAIFHPSFSAARNYSGEMLLVQAAVTRPNISLFAETKMKAAANVAHCGHPTNPRRWAALCGPTPSPPPPPPPPPFATAKSRLGGLPY